ncbi:hypothetical protein GMORB2_3708 [Geosmithia morbida]|uniref:Uncharacterized protein n=1 Tax=Geosmithia morbida TaxID=1094350 RepID=A0A9P4YZX8_9HYPO|nr:uncharacterized protein GMORB2_3708 [Geosmithia morbida]KAF4124869.1 hypothetical protein GMORB2_3708 [Geosmithia morbida]
MLRRITASIMVHSTVRAAFALFSPGLPGSAPSPVPPGSWPGGDSATPAGQISSHLHVCFERDYL